MANEITFSGSISFFKPSVMAQADGLSVVNLLRNMTSNAYVKGEYTVTTAATALPLGNVTQPHIAWIYNTDGTNYIQVQNGASGAVLCRFPAGLSLPLPFDPGAVPYVIANTASVVIQYLIIGL